MPSTHPSTIIFSNHSASVIYSLSRTLFPFSMSTRPSRPSCPPPVHSLILDWPFRLCTIPTPTLWLGMLTIARPVIASCHQHTNTKFHRDDLQPSVLLRSLHSVAAFRLVSRNQNPQIQINITHLFFPFWLLTGAVLAVLTPVFSHPSQIFCTTPLYDKTPDSLFVFFGFTCRS